MNWFKIGNDDNSMIQVKNHTAVHFMQKVYIFGGFDGSKHKNSLSVYDSATKSLAPMITSGDVPSGRNGHTATLHGSDIFIIGGCNSANNQTTQEIYVLHLDQMMWEKIIPEQEKVLSCNMHTANLYKHKIFVFRGGDGYNYLNDLHFYDIETNTWNSVEDKGSPPTPRANHASAIYNENLYIFGGWNGVDRLNDLITFSLTENQWKNIQIKEKVPKARAGVSLNVIKEGILMFGGSGVSSKSYNDLYIFKIATNTWEECKTIGDSPTPRAGHTLTSISNREYLLIGGSSGSQYSNSYYILDICPPPIARQIEKPAELSFLQFYNNPQFSDIQFLIEGRTVYAHKVIITRLSEHLNLMFTSNMRESWETVVEFKSIKYSVFMILLKYLYTGDPEIDAGTEGQEITTEYLIEILKTADRFLLDAITQRCEHILVQRITPENAFAIKSILEHTQAMYLKQYCHWVIENSW